MPISRKSQKKYTYAKVVFKPYMSFSDDFSLALRYIEPLHLFVEIVFHNGKVRLFLVGVFGMSGILATFLILPKEFISYQRSFWFY